MPYGLRRGRVGQVGWLGAWCPLSLSRPSKLGLY